MFVKINSVFIFLILLGLTFLIIPSDKTTVNHFHIETQPQEYMNGIFIQNYTEKGELKNQLSASYWAYMPEISASIFNNPFLITYRMDGSEWRIRAEEGRAKQPKIGSIEEVTLSKHVVIERPATTKIQHIRIETEKLRYQPDKDFAESDVLVKMMKPGLLMSGIGLKAYLNQNVVHLLNKVETKYVANVLKPTEPVIIHSESAEFDEKNDKAIYRTSVVMTQAARQLNSDILIIEKDKAGKINSMVATGNPALFNSEMNPNNPARGHAERINYYPKQNKIHFLQNAELTQNNNTIRSDQFSYDLTTETLYSESTHNQRTTVILQPKGKS